MALTVKNKLGIVDGSIGQPPAEDPYVFFLDQMLHHDDFLDHELMSKEITATITYFDTAEAISKDM